MGQGIYMSGCVEMWQLQQPKNRPTVQHSTKEQKELRLSFSGLNKTPVHSPALFTAAQPLFALPLLDLSDI